MALFNVIQDSVAELTSALSLCIQAPSKQCGSLSYSCERTQSTSIAPYPPLRIQVTQINFRHRQVERLCLVLDTDNCTVFLLWLPESGNAIGHHKPSSSHCLAISVVVICPRDVRMKMIFGSPAFEAKVQSLMTSDKPYKTLDMICTLDKFDVFRS